MPATDSGSDVARWRTPDGHGARPRGQAGPGKSEPGRSARRATTIDIGHCGVARVRVPQTVQRRCALMSRVETRSPPSLEPKARLRRLSARASRREQAFMPTRLGHGTTFMSVSRLSGSTIRKPIHKTVHARIGRKNFSVVCVVLKSASTIALRERTFSATPKKVHGEKITDV
jgi:hypothetical protein